MFKQSPTLQEINGLIHNSDANCNHCDVTILDLRPLISRKMRNFLEEQGMRHKIDHAYDVSKAILVLKEPDVILSLQCET